MKTTKNKKKSESDLKLKMVHNRHQYKIQSKFKELQSNVNASPRCIF